MCGFDAVVAAVVRDSSSIPNSIGIPPRVRPIIATPTAQMLRVFAVCALKCQNPRCCRPIYNTTSWSAVSMKKKFTSFRYAVKCPEPASKSLSVHHTMPRTALLPGYGYGGTIDELRRQEFDRLGTTGETSETHHDHQWHSSINIAGPSRDDFPLPVVFMLTRAASW